MKKMIVKRQTGKTTDQQKRKKETDRQKEKKEKKI